MSTNVSVYELLDDLETFEPCGTVDLAETFSSEEEIPRLYWKEKIWVMLGDGGFFNEVCYRSRSFPTQVHDLFFDLDSKP